MSLVIEYGCVYNCLTGQVCHNSGPYTDNECQHDHRKEKELIESIEKSRKNEIEAKIEKRKQFLRVLQPRFDEKVDRYLKEKVQVDERLLLSREEYFSNDYELRLPQQILDEGTYTIAFDRNDNVYLVRYDVAFSPKYYKWVYIY